MAKTSVLVANASRDDYNLNANMRSPVYWYNYSDINKLLIEKSEAQTHYMVIEATSTDNLQTLQRVSEVFKALKELNSPNVAVIPINLGRSNQGVWQGSHSEFVGKLSQHKRRGEGERRERNEKSIERE